MQNFIPKSKTYRVNRENMEKKEILEIKIEDISPDIRDPDIPTFKNSITVLGVKASSNITDNLQTQRQSTITTHMRATPMMPLTLKNAKLTLDRSSLFTRECS